MNSDCIRWVSIADREAIGHTLSEEEASFRRAHESTCAACTREAAAWSDLGKRPLDLPVESAEVDALLRLFASEPASVVGKRSSRRVVALAGALAAAAAVALIWKASARKETSTQGGAVHMVVATGTLLGSANEALPAGSELLAGTLIESRDVRSCLAIDPGVRACFEAGSRARVVGTLLSDRRIELLSGRVSASLEPQPQGSGFTIATKAGTVSAVGTEFEVEVGDMVKIAVLKGVVLVRANDGAEQRLAAPRTLTLGESAAIEPGPNADRAAAQDEPSPPPAPASAMPAGSSTTGADKTREPASHPGDLLQQAREERERGRFAKAAELYRKLQATSPDSPEARVALVSLGDLQLSHLSDPAGALRSFDAYLRNAGGLTQEAWYGKIQALRVLGRSGDERAAIEQFLRTYPAAVQSSALKARLSELR